MSQVIVKKTDYVLNVRLNRPQAHNALNLEIMAELSDIFSQLKKERAVRVVVLEGEGPSFCAGGDLNWMKSSIKYNISENIKDIQKLSRMYEAIFQCPIPVIGKIQGHIMGGGLGLTAVCDIVAAESSSKFCFSELKIGMVPSIISPYVLRKIPESQARLLMLTAEVFDSSLAKEIGLVHFVGSQEAVETYVDGKVRMIVDNAPEGARITKEVIQKIKTSTESMARQFTVKTIAQRRVSKEGQEGLAAFFAKRNPSWRDS